MNFSPLGASAEPVLFGNLLEEPLLHYRRTDSGERVAATLPELFVAMAQDDVHDFPSLRPHQRHAWHAFLVQLAAVALHRAECDTPLTTTLEWWAALLSLTPDDLDGAAWCLASPVNRPAFMQPPEPSGSIDGWKNQLMAADELDRLMASKNHDVKAGGIANSTPEDWVYALINLQTQEGILGAENYGTSRMDGGLASRWGVDIHPNGGWGARWQRDLVALMRHRDVIAQSFNFPNTQGHALIWTIPWDGSDSLSFLSLDPWHIEVCRRVRLTYRAQRLGAWVAESECARIIDKEAPPRMRGRA